MTTGPLGPRWRGALTLGKSAAPKGVRPTRNRVRASNVGALVVVAVVGLAVPSAMSGNLVAKAGPPRGADLRLRAATARLDPPRLGYMHTFTITNLGPRRARSVIFAAKLPASATTGTIEPRRRPAVAR